MKRIKMNREIVVRAFGIATALLVTAWAQSAYAATEVNACGQSFSGGGFLAADLDCTGFPGDAVTIDGGTLDLRGFTLTGGTDAGVFCSRNCKVVSDPPGGRIENSGGPAIDGATLMGPTGVTVRALDIVVDGNAGGVRAQKQLTLTRTSVLNDAGLESVASDKVKIVESIVDTVAVGAIGGKVKIFDSQLSNCFDRCAFSSSSLLVKESTVTGSGVAGLQSTGRVRLVDSDVSGNPGDGVSAASLDAIRVVRTTINGNGGAGVSDTLAGKTSVFVDSMIAGNGLEGIKTSSPAKVVRSTIQGNGLGGIGSGPTSPTECKLIKVKDSTVTGNGTDASCGIVQTCYDVGACSAPQLNNTTCDTSYDTNSGFPGTSWGICSLD